MVNAALDRTQGIGGSDAAAVLGISPHKTPLRVYQEKLGLCEPEPETPAMRWGKLLEDAVADEYAHVTGRKVRRRNVTLRHEDHPFLTAHIDRDVVGGKRILEVKTANAFAHEWGPAGTDEIPPAYVVQVQHYLAVTDNDVCDVAALIGGQDFRLYEVQRDDDLIRMMLDEEVRFWREHVEPRVPPAPSSAAECSERWRRAVIGSTITANEAFLLDVQDLVVLKAQAKANKRMQDELRRRIFSALGDHEAAVDETGSLVVTWKNRKQFDVAAFVQAFPELSEDPRFRRFDPALLKAQQPTVHRQFVTTSDTRVLRLCVANAEDDDQ